MSQATTPDTNVGKLTADRFVEEVEKRMVKLGWDAKALCSAAGCHWTVWDNLKRGRTKPHLDSVAKMAEAVGLQVTFRKKPSPALS